MGFVLTKLVSLFVTPAAFLIELFILAEILSRSLRHQTAGRNLRYVLIAALIFIAIFPVGEWALLPLENAFPPSVPDHVDGIILLGGDEDPHISSVRGQPTVLSSAPRYLEFTALVRQFPQAQLVFTGGSGKLVPDSAGREADVARSALGTMGVPIDNMIFENRSRTTYENAKFTAEIVHPKPSQSWLLVTSARHIPRSMACFTKTGWHVYAAPAGYRTDGHFRLTGHMGLAEQLLELKDALHEYYGLVAYDLTGRIDTLWPHPQNP